MRKPSDNPFYSGSPAKLDWRCGRAVDTMGFGASAWPYPAKFHGRVIDCRLPTPCRTRGAFLGSSSPTSWRPCTRGTGDRSEEHTSELQSLMRISYAVFCLKKKN